MSDKLHALKWNKPATSSLCFNSIIPFSLLQGFHHHCEHIHGASAEETEVLSVNSARQLFPLVIASRRRNNLTPRHPEGATRLKDLMIDHGILRLLRTTLSVGLLRSFLSLAMTFRVIIALLWASAHLLLADKTDCLSHADTMQRAAGYSLLSGHQMVIKIF